MTHHVPPTPKLISALIKPHEEKVPKPEISSQRTVFLDRDGTINVEKGYISDPKAIELYSDVNIAIKLLNSWGYLVIIVTNQAAIGRQLLTVEQFNNVNKAIWNKLLFSGAYYDGIYYCPHDPNTNPECCCRKPRPGLIFQAALDFNIDLSYSYFIGDKVSDIEAGVAGGCKSILVLTGYGKESLKKFDKSKNHGPIYIASTLLKAVQWIISQDNEVSLLSKLLG